MRPSVDLFAVVEQLARFRGQLVPELLHRRGLPLALAQVRSLDVDDPAVTEAAEILGLGRA